MLDARLPRVMAAMIEQSRKEFLARAEALAKMPPHPKAEKRPWRPGEPLAGPNKLLRAA